MARREKAGSTAKASSSKSKMKQDEAVEPETAEVLAMETASAPKPSAGIDDATSGLMSSLQESISPIFDQSQLSISNHRKNCVALYKLHVQASKEKTSTKGKGKVKNNRTADHGGDETRTKLVGEKVFVEVFMDMVSRVLVIKKGTPGAEKVVKFVGSYAKYLNERVANDREKARANGKATNDEEDEDTVATRFITRLVKWLLQGFLAKEKTVRYRCVHLVSEMISHLGEIDEDLYEQLRSSVLDRVNDREPFIRTHAVVALSKLVGSEDPDEVQEGEMTSLEILLNIMQHDPSPDVRRAALLNVPLTPGSLDILLTRTRDTDAITRKLIYSVVLKQKLKHPRMLTLDQREQVVKDGLGDREPGVRLAAGKMIGNWFDIMLAESGSGARKEKANNESDEQDNIKEEDKKRNQPASLREGWDGDDGGAMSALIQVLGLFDVVGAGETVAVDAILSIFVTRPDLLSVFVFTDAYWSDLTPESAVLARMFVEHSLTRNDASTNKDSTTTTTQASAESFALLESAQFPVVTAFAFYIQQAYNDLLQTLQDCEQAKLAKTAVDDEESDAKEEELAKREVILSELLRMAVKLDYGDEIGRRKIFSVVRDMLAHPELPPGLIEKSLDVLREISPSERDLIRVVVEIVVELRDKEDENYSMNHSLSQADTTTTSFRRENSLQRTRDRKSMTHEERIQADITDMRCLLLCIGMLERVNGNFEDNSTLEGVLADLIIPAVKRKELPMREKGLVSLGLCCLIAKNMALNSFQLFVNQVQNAPEHLQLQVLKVIFDLLIMYEQDFFGRSEEMAERIILFLLHTLENSESDSVKAGLCIGLSKLLLTGLVKDPRVLTSLLVNYVHPTTMGNQELRQCLSYFFPVYCYASPVNQSRMQSVFLPVLELIGKIHEELEEGQTMVTPYQFGLQMLDWTNPQKVASSSNRQDASDAHADLAIDLLASLYDTDKNEEELKILCQFLGQLQLARDIEPHTLLKLDILQKHHEEQCPFNNASLEKLFNKFQTRFEKTYHAELDRLDRPRLYDEQIQKLYGYIGVNVPDELLSGERAAGDDEGTREGSTLETETPKPVRRSAAPSPAIVTTKGKRRMHDPEEELEDIEEEDEDEQPPPSKVDVAQDSASEDDEGTPTRNESPPPAVATPRQRRGVKRMHTTPGSSAPRARKKNRVSPEESEDETAPSALEESDASRPTTPTPITKKGRKRNQPLASQKGESKMKRPGKGRNASAVNKATQPKRAAASRVTKAPSPDPLEEDSGEAEAFSEEDD